MTNNAMMRIFPRILNLFFYPATEWEKIAAENSSRKTVYIQFIVPLLCVIAIANIIGTWLNASRELYTVGFVVYKIAVRCISLSVGLYVSTFVIVEIMAQQLGAKNYNRDFALMAYSSGAAYLVIVIVGLFPFFNEFLVLAFYSCYMYWQGIPHMIQIEDRQRITYALFSYFVILLTYSLAFFFFGRVLGALLVV